MKTMKLEHLIDTLMHSNYYKVEPGCHSVGPIHIFSEIQ